MRIYLVLFLLSFSAAVQASSSLRVGNRLIVAGDSRERVTELLGKPTSKTHRRKRASFSRGRRRGGVRVVNNDQGGEQWRYRRDQRVIVVTLVNSRVTDIEEHRL